MKKINSIVSICALSLVLGTAGVQAGNMHSMNKMGSGMVNYGFLTPEKQETFSMASGSQMGNYGQCMVKNLSVGRVILVIPHDRTLVLTPQTTSGTFNLPKQDYFYAKYTLKKSASPLSVVNPMNVVKATTAPFTSGTQHQASEVMLMCRTY